MLTFCSWKLLQRHGWGAAGESLCKGLDAWVWGAYENALGILVHWGLEDGAWWEVSLCSAVCGVGTEHPSRPATPWKRQGSSGGQSWTILTVTHFADNLIPQPRGSPSCTFKWGWPILGRSWISFFPPSTDVAGERKETRSTWKGSSVLRGSPARNKP